MKTINICLSTSVTDLTLREVVYLNLFIDINAVKEICMYLFIFSKDSNRDVIVDITWDI